MARKAAVRTRSTASQAKIKDDMEVVPAKLQPSSLLDTCVIYFGNNLEQLAKLPEPLWI
jgi:hypothetical protein